MGVEAGVRGWVTIGPAAERKPGILGEIGLIHAVLNARRWLEARIRATIHAVGPASRRALPGHEDA
jgi:hypothetical protein